MELHETLYELGLTSGRTVFDDADLMRAALDDYLDEGAASTGDINLLVDAVRLGAFRMMLTMIDSGAEPSRAVESAGQLLARDRGTSDVDATRWACAVLGFAVGRVSATDVRRFDRRATQPRPSDPPPTTTRAPWPPPVSPPSPQVSPTGPPPVSPPQPAAYPTAYPAANYPAPAYPPQHQHQHQPSPRKRGPWLAIGIVSAVLLVIGGILAAVLLAGGDDKEKVDDDTGGGGDGGERISGASYSFVLLDGWRDVTEEVLSSGSAGATDLAVAWGSSIQGSRANVIVETGYAQGETDPEELRSIWENNMATATGATPVDNGTTTFDGENAIGVLISRVNENDVAIEQFGYLAIHEGDYFSVILSAEEGDEKAQDAYTEIIDSWSWDN